MRRNFHSAPGVDRFAVRQRDTGRSRFLRPQLAFDQVDITNEFADRQVCRFVINLARRTNLMDFASVHYRYAVRHRQGLFLIVRHIYERGSGVVLNPLQFALHVTAQTQVQRRQWLVQEKQAWSTGQCAGQCDALLLPARQLCGPALSNTFQPHQIQHTCHGGVDRRFGFSQHLE